MSSFVGRVVIITGAAGCVGRKVTQRWLDAGASVLAVDASQAALDSLPDHASMRTISADISSESGAREVVESATHGFGPPDTLIHLVGGFAMGAIDSDDAVDNWDKMVLLNLHTSFHMIRAVAAGLKQRGGGWIVAMGSKAAHSTPGRMSAYVATKAGLIALCQSLSEELKGHGIHINVILPSTIDTPANRAAMGDAAAAKWVTSDDIAGATMFLCSDEGRGLYGATLEVYGLS